MTLTEIIIITPLIIAGCWYSYRWGRQDGYAEGHADGELGIQRPVAPQAGGGPGVPEK